MSLHYGWEAFYSAVLTCAQGNEPPSERLRRAYQEAVRAVQAEDVPVDLRAELAALQARLALLDGGGAAERRTMPPPLLSPEEVSELIDTLVELFDKIARAVGRWHG
jgi:hypothetical protein